MTDSENELVVGAINGVYGIKGWLKVYSYTSPIEQILEYQPWILRKGKKQQTLEISDGKQHGKGIIVRPDEFESRTDAESLIGYEVRILRSQLPALPEGDYYWYELRGLTVVNEAGEVLGLVKEMIETGANDVLVVAANEASLDDKERLIPLVMDEVVLSVDTDASEIRVAWSSDW